MAAEGLGFEAPGKGPALGDMRALPVGLGLGVDSWQSNVTQWKSLPGSDTCRGHSCPSDDLRQ